MEVLLDIYVDIFPNVYRDLHDVLIADHDNKNTLICVVVRVAVARRVLQKGLKDIDKIRVEARAKKRED